MIRFHYLPALLYEGKQDFQAASEAYRRGPSPRCYVKQRLAVFEVRRLSSLRP